MRGIPMSDWIRVRSCMDSCQKDNLEVVESNPHYDECQDFGWK